MYRAKWTKEQTCCQGTMSLQRNGCSTCSRFREFGKSLAVLFASEVNSHCPIFFTRSTDALAHEWPSLPLYAFPPVALLPQVLSRVREQRHKLILIAPLWRNQPWVSEVFQLLKAARGWSPWDRTSSLKRTAQYGIHGRSYGPCMCGHLTGAICPPRACPKLYVRI